MFNVSAPQLPEFAALAGRLKLRRLVIALDLTQCEELIGLTEVVLPVSDINETEVVEKKFNELDILWNESQVSDLFKAVAPETIYTIVKHKTWEKLGENKRPYRIVPGNYPCPSFCNRKGKSNNYEADFQYSH